MGNFNYFEHLLKPTYNVSYFANCFELKETVNRVSKTILQRYGVQSFTWISLQLKKLWSFKIQKVKKTAWNLQEFYHSFLFFSKSFSILDPNQYKMHSLDLGEKNTEKNFLISRLGEELHVGLQVKPKMSEF